MRLALVADIHGNSAALRAVLADARRHGASRLVVLGDIVGYYYAPHEVIDLIEDWDADVVRGNHEDLFARWQTEDDATREGLRRRYGSGFSAAASVLDGARLAWLRDLPHPTERVVAGVPTLFAHGHPSVIDRYVYPDKVASALDPADVAPWDFVWLGHTHYPMDVRVGGTRILNPGSVGQPRDGDPRAAWALWDIESGAVTLRRSAYSRERLVAEVSRRDPDVPFMAQVLTRLRGAI